MYPLLEVDDEILLDDSDDFVDNKSDQSRPTKRQKLSHSKEKSKSPTLDEDKVKNILDKVAISKKCLVSVANPEKKSQQSQRSTLTNNWKNAQNQLTSSSKKSTPQSSKRGQHKPITIGDSDPEDDFRKNDSLNSSRRVTRGSSKSSLNASKNSSNSSFVELDDDEGEELEKEIAKIDKMKSDLKKQFNKIEKKSSEMKSPAVTPKLRKSSSTPASVKIKMKQDKTSSKKKKIKESKVSTLVTIKNEKKKPVKIPQIIDLGPWDCFDNLIVKTTLGFPCNFCEVVPVFQKRREMIQHLQVQHDEELTDEQRRRELGGVFECGECYQEFHSKHILKTHMRGHQRLRRGNCDKYFKYYLNIKLV